MMIRKATHEDALDILSIYAPFVRESAITFEYDVPGVEVMAERIVSYSEKFPWLVAEVDGQIAGYAYATSYRERKAYQWSCEASVYV
ncbi:MAG: GNAT family N-acetyltransferase, partial [Flavobacteriales bacterium]|nr:GNAT family N-acetyltransferase [Flavobacteriales bacterium]